MILDKPLKTYCWVCREQTMHTEIVDTPERFTKEAVMWWLERIGWFIIMFGLSEIFIDPVHRCDKCGYRERFDGTKPSVQ